MTHNPEWYHKWYQEHKLEKLEKNEQYAKEHKAEKVAASSKRYAIERHLKELAKW